MEPSQPKGSRIHVWKPAVTFVLVLPPPLCPAFSRSDSDVTGVECQPRAGCQAKQPGRVCVSSVPEKEGHQKT